MDNALTAMGGGAAGAVCKTSLVAAYNTAVTAYETASVLYS